MSLLLEHPKYEDFKDLAIKRIIEAEILLKNNQFSGAYYLAGYSIELALKACYCKSVPEKSFPPKKDVYDKLYKHDLGGLLVVSGILTQFNENLEKSDMYKVNWETVKDWNEQSRYAVMLEKDARPIIEAITGKDGILGLIKTLW